jgi:Phage antirepressor protein KilAC domain
VIPAIITTGTYSATTAPAVPALNSPEAILALATAYHEAAMQLVGVQRRVAELAPAAEAWEVLAEGTGNYSLREAAAILTQDPAISIGQNRLMTFVRDEGMVDAKGRPYAKHNRHLVQRPVSYNHPRTGEPVLIASISAAIRSQNASSPALRLTSAAVRPHPDFARIAATLLACWPSSPLPVPVIFPPALFPLP